MVDTQPAPGVINPTVPRQQILLCAWCAVPVVLLIGGGLLLSGLWPPPSPTDSAETITAFYAQDPFRTRLGLALMIAGAGFILPWAASIAAQIRRIETASPALTMVQIAGFSVTTLLGVASMIGWSLASFRPGEVPTEITRAFSDLGWFFFVFDWSPPFVWYMAVAIAILGDRTASPIYPRWAGYLTLWVALLSAPAGAMIFFKTGPLAYNGVFAIWIPLAVFFIFIVVMTPLTIRAVSNRPKP